MPPLVRILYAEDEPDIQQVVSLALEVVGDFNLKICNSGLEAVNEVETFKPQLLLLDVMMPELDGPGALKSIRTIEAYREIPAIFLTAKVQAGEIQDYFEMGVLDVIAKPFDPMILAEQIEEMWAKVSS
ncbi:MAG: two-component system OmpR family response regulator [Oceanospirillaceae bacterium]|jgi:two-component system OmpR family response regulator